MRRGILLSVVATGVLLLAACTPSLQPQVDKLTAQVASLQQDKVGLQTQVSSLQQNVSSLQQDKTGLQNQVSSVQQNVTSLKGDKDKLQAQIDSLSKDNSSLQQDSVKLKRQVQVLTDMAGPPPASLDKLNPPNAPAPLYLIEMFNLEGAFSAIGTDLQEQDIPGVQKNYQAFKAEYTKISGMVPEFRPLMPTAPVDALGAALASGDPSKVGPAMGQVGAVCGNCHLINQIKAHQKYQWPSFDNVKLTDPVAKDTVTWGDYMTRMGGSYSAIGTDLSELKLDKARQNFADFSARFKALPSSGCNNKACHGDSPRLYFVDARNMALVDSIGKELSVSTPDPKKLGDMIGALGNDSCMACHLVHMPAQNSKDRWEALPDLLK